MKPALAVLLILTLVPALSGAQDPARFDLASLPDTYEARARYLTSVVTANWNSAVRFPETYLQTGSGRVQISVERTEDFFFARFLRDQAGDFPLAAVGNTIIQRNYQRNGDLIQAKIFLSDDPSCYIRLYPQSERTRADIILYGAVVRQGALLPQLFYYQLREHVSGTLTAAAGSSFDPASFFRAPGSPSAAVRFGQALTAGRVPSGAAGRIVAGLAGDQNADGFLSGPARSLGGVETADVPDRLFADDRDPRLTASYRPFPSYEPGKGVPVSAASAVVHSESLARPDDVFAAFVQDGTAARRFLLLAGFGQNGAFSIEAYDPVARSFLSWPDFAAAHRQAFVRLIRLPAPQP